MSALEVVLLAPLVIGFVLVLVGFGVLVDARGSVAGAARDASRMGSLQRDAVSADSAAQAVAQSELAKVCSSVVFEQIDPVSKTRSQVFTPGTLYTVRVSCTVSLAGINWANLGSQTIVCDATSPLDQFRRSG
jgi:Flp pilus assembly protein TadG